MERIVRPGEFYRHFKNKLYQIIAIAVHSETEEPMVVYQALYGDYKTYVRPYDMFVSEVDHEKYPEVTQRYRFERVAPGTGTTAAGSMIWQAEPEDETAVVFTAGRSGNEPSELVNTASQAPNPYLLEFLDAEGYEKQMECLKHLADTASQSDLDSIYLVLDMKHTGGSVREQVEHIKRYLSMQHHFDGTRLR